MNAPATQTATQVNAYELGLEAERKLVEEIESLKEKETAAVAAAIASAPGESAYKPNGAADLARRKRQALEARLYDLRERELPMREQLAREARQRARDEAIAAAVKRARVFDAIEAAALERAAGAFGEFVDAWRELAEAAARREKIAAELDVDGLLGREAERERSLRHFTSTVTPFPGDPMVLADLIVSILTDEHRDAELFLQQHPDAQLLLPLLAGAGPFVGLDLSFTEVRHQLRAPAVRRRVTEAGTGPFDARGVALRRAG
jgi:hypothetical protein